MNFYIANAGQQIILAAPHLSHSFCLLLHQYYTEACIVQAAAGFDATAIGTAALHSTSGPTATTQYAICTVIGTFGVGNDFVCCTIFSVPIGAPFLYITVHIAESPSVGFA